MKVLNIRNNIRPSDNVIYIGRKNVTYGVSESKWHNPNPITSEMTLDENLNLYEERVRNTPELWDSLEELEDKDLLCWCQSENKCHGGVLIKLIEEKKLNKALIF